MEIFAEKNKLIPNNSCGFRKGRGIDDYILTLLSVLKVNKKNNFKTALILTDLSKAFDNVVPNVMADILSAQGFAVCYSNWIYNFMVNRKLIMESGKRKTTVITSKGLPQGSSLSPLLFNLYTAGLHCLSDLDCEIVQYADDIAFLVRAKTWNGVEDKANVVMQAFVDKLNNLNLSLNINKCKVMCFHKNMLNKIEIKINNVNIEEVRNANILGIQ